jgi:hypothetical protein
MPEIRVHWPDLENEHGGRMLWFGAWLVGRAGDEGGWFYSGRGGEVTGHEIPTEASGARLRRWPSEGLDPEYVDVPVSGDADVDPLLFDFDRAQPHSRLRRDGDRVWVELPARQAQEAAS